MEKYKLKDLVLIRLGYNFRIGIDSIDDGNVHVIQPHNIFSSSVEEAVRISSVGIKKHNFLYKNDIILTNRVRYRAYLFNLNTPTITSNGSFILTVQSNLVLAKYIEIFLNSSTGQISLKRQQEGITVPSISLKNLENIEIPLISLKQQKQIISLASLYEQEMSLMKRILSLKEKQFHQIFKGVINE